MTTTQEKDVYIQQMDDLIKSWSGDVRYGDAPWSMRNMYCTVAREALRTNRQELLDATVKYFPEACRMFIEGNIHFKPVEVREVVEFFSHKQNTDALMRIEHSDQAMAWFCGELSLDYFLNNDVPEPNPRVLTEQYIQLLDNWSGATFPRNINPELTNIVDFLYGKACWSLYGCDLNSATLDEFHYVMKEIAQSNLPLVFRATSIDNNVSSVDTLGDII